MIRLIIFIAFLYLLVELLSRTTQGADGKIRFERVPTIFVLNNGIFFPATMTSIIEVDVKEVDKDKGTDL